MSTMKAWQYTGAVGGLDMNLKLNEDAARPPRTLSSDQLMVEVITMSVNPVDYKIPELGMLSKLMVKTPASPGQDYCGKVVATGPAVDNVQSGQLVFGRLAGPSQFGSLGQFIVAPKDGCVPLPSGVEPDHAATVGTAGLTAYQCLATATQDDRVFINGGSGGTGVFGIQIAKAKGCHVTTSCSTPNVFLCKSLGADEVIDYKASDISEELKKRGAVFDLVVDNVGSPLDLYTASNTFLKSTGKFVQVGAPIALSTMGSMASRILWPGILGGGKHPFQFLTVVNNRDELAQIGAWMQEGKVKAVIDSAFEYSDAPKAYERVKTGRAKGKIVVHVTNKPQQASHDKL